MIDILDGKIARDFYKKALKQKVLNLPQTPTLVLIQVGNNPQSNVYIEQKKRFANDLGVSVRHIQIKDTDPEHMLIDTIQTYNKDASVHGIIIQLPLPTSYDKQRVIDTIDPRKDVDGLTTVNQNNLEHTPLFVPATARGVFTLLDFYHIDYRDKKVCIFGRSKLVSGPIARIMQAQGVDVSVCSRDTKNPKTISKQADIVIVAIGQPEMIDETYIKRGSVVIDIGITATPHGIRGDVAFSRVAPLVKAITPVPGGVGPMTVLSLFANLIVSAERNAAHITQ